MEERAEFQQSAVFLIKLERELEKLDFKHVEETLAEELEYPKSSLVQNPNFDSVNKNCPSKDPVLVWTCENGHEYIECALKETKISAPCTCNEDPKLPPTLDPTEKSKRANDSPPAEISTKVKADSDEESLRDQDIILQTKESIPTAKDPILSRTDDKAVMEHIQFKDAFDLEKESMTEEEIIQFLLPEEKKELEALSEATKLQSDLIETRSKVWYSQLRNEAEAHCLSIQQKAIDETLIFNRPSSDMAKEYSQTILMVMKYLEIQLKKVASCEESFLKSVVDDFNKNEQQVFNKATERKQLHSRERISVLEKKVKRKAEKPSHVHNPLVFYFTFVIIMTLFSIFVVHLQVLK